MRADNLVFNCICIVIKIYRCKLITSNSHLIMDLFTIYHDFECCCIIRTFLGWTVYWHAHLKRALSCVFFCKSTHVPTLPTGMAHEGSEPKQDSCAMCYCWHHRWRYCSIFWCFLVTRKMWRISATNHHCVCLFTFLGLCHFLCYCGMSDALFIFSLFFTLSLVILRYDCTTQEVIVSLAGMFTDMFKSSCVWFCFILLFL